MEEIAADMREGLLALAVGAGLQVMQQLMQADVTSVCGLKASRTRTEGRPGTALKGGRFRWPADGSRYADRESARPTAAVSCRCRRRRCSTSPNCSGGWPWSGCSAGSRPGTTGAAWSPSARRSRSRRGRPASRRSPGEFVAMTETALTDLLAKDLTDLDLVALMIDGVYLAEHLCVVALGIDIDRTKHPLGLIEGSTENTTVVKTLLTGLRDRGLDTTKPIMAVLDGAKALAAGVKEVFDKPVIGRCQLHKLRNVRDHLPQNMRGPVEKRMRKAYHADSALEAEAQLTALAKELDKTHPGAAGSLREGMAETLTVLRLDVPPTLARTLRSTNAVESMISISRDHARNVKRWRDGQMALRWRAAGMVEASKQFRRVNGHLHLPALRAALERHVAGGNVGPDCNTQDVSAA